MGMWGPAAHRSALRKRCADRAASMVLPSDGGNLRTHPVAFGLAVDNFNLRHVTTDLARLKQGELAGLTGALPPGQSIGRRFQPEHVGPGVEVAPLEEGGELLGVVAQDHPPRGVWLRPVDEGHWNPALTTGRHLVGERLLSKSGTRSMELKMLGRDSACRWRGEAHARERGDQF